MISSLFSQWNPSQELFMVVFSILYGTMLQMLPSGLFPMGSFCRGHVNRFGVVDNDHEKVRRLRIRTIVSIFFVNVLPALYFFMVLWTLDCANPPEKSLGQFFYLLCIFWASLGSFGFYRLYHAIWVYFRNGLFFDMTCEFIKRNTSYDVGSNFLWFFLYVVPGPVFLWLIY